ncbi:radical SAM protein [Brevibacillus gelatini]|uniref:radical SAM protein n=1 Tax=Brevibacillus gelatini TaxID=1655277 RepID=UPI003D815FBE
MEPIALNRSTEKIKTEKEIVNWSRYNFQIEPSEDTNGKYLLYNSLTGKLITSKFSFDSLHDYYKNPVMLRDSEELLLNMGFVVPNNINELSVTRYQLNEKKSSRDMSLIILPTEQCNFRCVYCYEEFLRGSMPTELQAGLIKWVSSNIHRWDSLTVSWFGGEPLIAYDVIKNVSTELVKICATHNVSYRAAMTTNGYLLSIDRVREFHSLGVIDYQITIDGSEEFHDKNRVLKGGQGTFRKIMDNLLAIQKSEVNVNVTIRTNFDRINSEVIPDFIDELANSFSNDRRFSLMLHPVGKWGGPNDPILPTCTSKEATDVKIKNSKLALQKGLKSTVAKSSILPDSVCYASMPNNLVIGANGTIYKCTVALDLPANQVGKLLENGLIEINKPRFSQWVSNDGVSDKVCQSCNVHPICHGTSCPLIRIEHGRRPCPPYKENMEDFIKLLYQESAV